MKSGVETAFWEDGPLAKEGAGAAAWAEARQPSASPGWGGGGRITEVLVWTTVSGCSQERAKASQPHGVREATSVFFKLKKS